MKKKITKIWSVGLVLVLLVSLLAFAAPASAAPLEWSEIKLPGPPTKQILFNSDASFITAASDGTLFAIDTQPVGADLVYKSNNGGTVWTVSEAIGVDLVALAVSPDYVNDGTVFALAAGPPAAQVYISTNSGAKFNVLGGTCAGTGTSLAVSPLYSGGTGEVMVGTTAGVGAYGDIYMWGAAGGVQNWVAQGVGDTTAPYTTPVADVTSCAFSPNYPIDATILVVGSTTVALGGTKLYTRVTGSAWDTWGPVVINAADEVGSATGLAIISSSIALPSDYNGSIPTLRRVYVATVSATPGNDSVYRITNDQALLPGDTFNPPSAVDQFTTVAYSGNFNEGTLFVGDANAGQVYRCANPTSPNPLWYAALNAPTGATGATCLALDPDFASNSKLYASTTGGESAVSVSDDGAVNFYQVGLIDTGINSIQDLAVASATEVFMATENGTATDSIWRSTNGGASWVRVLAANFTNTPIVRLSPDFATDQTLWVADPGTTVMRLSQNGGAGWAARIGAGALVDMVAADGFTLYSLVGAALRQSNNGGWTWPVPPKPIAGATGGVNSIALDNGTGDIVVGGAGGTIHRLTAGAIEFEPGIGGPTGLGAVGAVSVAFDAGYANNGILYATAAGVAGIWRFEIGRDTSWAAIGVTVAAPNDTPAAGNAAGMATAADGSLYVANAAANGGVQRSMNAAGPPPEIEWSNAAGGPNKLPAGATLASLALTEGSNVLFAAENSGAAKLYTYTDTLTTTSPTPLAPDNGSIATTAGGANTVRFTWDPPANATPPFQYVVQYDTRADFKTPTNLAAVVHPVNYATNAAALADGKTYYWRVRVSAPVTGAWSEAWTLTTQLSAQLNAPVPGGPTERGTAPGGWDAPLSPTFSWGAYKNASGYHFQLAKDAAFTDVLANETLGPVTSYQYTKALDYSTTYYWRVKALGADTDTDWSSVAGFTTMAKPAPAAPPVVVEQVPAPIINIPAAPPAQQIVIPPAPAPPAPIAPTYIWGIIAIGAILVIAVIVLIVRTRRAV